MTRASLLAEQKKTPKSWMNAAFPQRTAVAPRAEHAFSGSTTTNQMEASAGNFARTSVRSTSCPITPTRCLFGGACHVCPTQVQAKLKINKPGDNYEQEADRMAELVMHMPEPGLASDEPQDEEETIQLKPLAGPGLKMVQRQVVPEEDGDEEEELIQAKSQHGPIRQVTPVLEKQIHALQGSGQPLSRSVRDFFEPRFGYDFGQVRVHTDSKAAQSARDVNALAFTHGRNLVFSAGQYAPETEAGRRLLGHELVHVVQQDRLSSSSTRINNNSKKMSHYTSTSVIQRECREFSDYLAPDTYCQTREEAEARVETACPPDRNCFVRNDGPLGYRWRRNPGWGCAHYVAHRLNIRSGSRHRRCIAGRSLTITDLISGMTSYPLASAQVNDVWTDGGHAGVVLRVGSGRRAGQVRVRHCRTSGTVGTNWKDYGNVYR